MKKCGRTKRQTAEHLGHYYLSKTFARKVKEIKPSEQNNADVSNAIQKLQLFGEEDLFNCFYQHIRSLQPDGNIFENFYTQNPDGNVYLNQEFEPIIEKAFSNLIDEANAWSVFPSRASSIDPFFGCDGTIFGHLSQLTLSDPQNPPPSRWNQ